jgi:hypothetical protein
MHGALLTWWLILCAAAASNILIWIWSAQRLAQNSAHCPPDHLATRRWLLLLSAGYVAGCAFRSVFPMVDVERMCLHNHWLSYIFIGRTVATVAELCFALQWTLLLREGRHRSGAAAFAARMIMPLIVLAEIFSWGAVITSNYLLHAIENSLWTVSAALALAGFLSLHRTAAADAARFLKAACLCAGSYVVFMVTVDVPMYLSRWQAVPAGDGSLPLEERLRTLINHCMVVHEWSAWREDVPWLTLYFTVAVWISIALAHAPSLRSTQESPKK